MRSFLSRPAFHPTGGLFELLGCLPEPCVCLWLLSQHENVGLVSWGRGGRQQSLQPLYGCMGVAAEVPRI